MSTFLKGQWNKVYYALGSIRGGHDQALERLEADGEINVQRLIDFFEGIVADARMAIEALKTIENYKDFRSVALDAIGAIEDGEGL